ncbi:hypothetical protein DAI22_12g193700 [Oryza sativa Japonica Group]|nr:hypothetical protein DAI22_12g193700 [Oryza sativa Japonica Group]
MKRISWDVATSIGLCFLFNVKGSQDAPERRRSFTQSKEPFFTAKNNGVSLVLEGVSTQS